ncbi:zinc finger and SCAN domain-containing protein 2 isoform X2 [Diachasma alloeum]|uniref:zinc finger and SCAN domain-containing protein 2 isoform X2 n=1 Tax=Diachasma alloeum TaxID=454923 RepID=UPI0007381889|nr:zinc finger and SCAN domain-containing protein 2 isoform X2 [Diachasma alloeum]
MEIFTPRLTAKYFLDDDDITGEKCRTCLKKTTDIWQVFQSDEEISSRIMACAAVQVQEGDGLPNVICYSCRELLDVSYNFKCQVEKSDAKFREALKMHQPMLHEDTVAQSVNEVITEAISDEISNRQMGESISHGSESVETYQTEEYLHDEDDDDDVDDDDDEEEDSVAFEGAPDGGNNDKKISLNISPFVESSEIFRQGQTFEKSEEDHLKSESINKEVEACGDQLNHMSDGKTLEEQIGSGEEKPFYLVLTKNTSGGENNGDNGGGDNEEMAKNTLDTSGSEVKEEGPVGCPRDKDFANKSCDQVTRINTEVTGNKTKYRYVCYMCEKQFVTVEKLKIHVADSHDCPENPEKNSGEVNPVENIPCDENETSEKNDTSGAVRKKKSKFSCKYCPKQFTYEKSFSTHAKRHPEYKKREKTVEGKDKCDERRLHNDSEDDDMPLEGLQCTQCGKLFATKRNLKRHLSTHSGLKFNCPTCQKEFSRADKMKEHEQSKHRNEFFSLSDDNNDTDTDNESENKRDGDNSDSRKKPHQCPMCPRSFAHSQTLANHVERHKRIKQPQKRFLCEVCSKCFAQSGSLVAHMRTHTGVKPYVCNVCSRAFTKSTYLQLHLRTHSGEKPYICQYCSRAFARANTLARHITMHTGEAKYHCQICMKSFRRLTSLNEHTFTHTGQRPYACKICTKRYNNAGSLYAHTKKCKAQQLSSSNPAISNYAVPLDNSHPSDPSAPMNCQPSPMLIYSPKKCDPEPPVNPETPMPEFILPNVQPEKSLSPNLIQPVSTHDTSLYSVNTKQFKNFYYTTYPSL